MFISTAYATGATGNTLSLNASSLSTYFLGQFENLTPWKIILGLVMGAIVGLIIAFVYKRCYRGVLYSPTFAMTLMMLMPSTTASAWINSSAPSRMPIVSAQNM